MELSDLELFYGIFTLVYVIFTLLIGFNFIKKYFKHKRVNLLLVGISWIGLAMHFINTSINFLLILFLDITIKYQIQLITTFIFIPIYFFCWLYAITDLLGIKSRSRYRILASSIILGIIHEILFFYFLIMNIYIIGIPAGLLYFVWGEYGLIVIFFVFVIIIITGSIFAIQSIKSPNQETKIRGKFLLFSFISLPIGLILGASAKFILVIIFAMGILCLSSITFYIGFMLPKWIKQYLLTQKELELH